MPRLGSMLLEVLVSAAILVATTGVVSQVATSIFRLNAETHRVQLACDELRNQMERLLSVESRKELDSALANLQITSELETWLPLGTLEGEVDSDELGIRIELAINWQRVAEAEPLRLIGWITNEWRENGDESASDRREPK